MMIKYFVEYVGVLIIVTAKLLTEADPVVMAFVYFSLFSLVKGISTGFLTPFGPLSMYILGRGDKQDMIYNLMAQLAGAVSAALLFKPIKHFIE